MAAVWCTYHLQPQQLLSLSFKKIQYGFPIIFGFLKSHNLVCSSAVGKIHHHGVYFPFCGQIKTQRKMFGLRWKALNLISVPDLIEFYCLFLIASS